MKFQYYAASSLDGFISTLDDSVDWLYPLAKIEDSSYPKFIQDVGAIVMGSVTYEFLLKYIEDNQWPYQQPVWVFTSRDLKTIPDAKIYFVQGNVQDHIDKIKLEAKNKNIWIMGGGELAGQFYDAGYLDEIIVQIGSVFLKQGKPFFPRAISFPDLTLNSIEKVGKGMTELRYEIKSEK